MSKEKPKRVQITTTLDSRILELVKQQPEPLSKFLDRAITNELSRSACAASRLAEAFQECIKAAIYDVIHENEQK